MTKQEILEDYKISKMALDIMTKNVNEKKQAVVEVLRDLPNEKAVYSGASFSLRSYKRYEFSDETDSLAIELSEAKKREIESGVAKVVGETVSPTIRIVKEK